MDRAAADGRIAAERAPTLGGASARFLDDARRGVALARGGRPFKPGTVYDYERSLNADLLPDYGQVRLDVLGHQLDTIVADLQRRGLAASSVRNAVMPLRAIYRHAVRMRWVAVNPTVGLEVPTGSGRRVRVIEPAMVEPYLAALDERDRPLWGTALYSGLRRGELMALRWGEVDLASGFVTVDPDHGGYDQKTKTTQAPKSAAGARRAPINGRLRELLAEHRARADKRATGLVFARGSLAGHCRKGLERGPFHDSTVGRRAEKAFTDAGLPRYTMHEFRHTFASLTIAAMAARGVFNPKLLQTILGHSSIQVTYDRYGHLFPGQEGEVGVMLDEFLAASGEALPEVTQGQGDGLSSQQTATGGGLVPSSGESMATVQDRPAKRPAHEGGREPL